MQAVPIVFALLLWTVVIVAGVTFALLVAEVAIRIIGFVAGVA